MELVVGRVIVTLQVFICTWEPVPRAGYHCLSYPLPIFAKDIICGSPRLEHRDRTTEYEW
jgi:hypothetical protein